MSDTFIAAVTIRNLDTEGNLIDNKSTSSFRLTLPSPVVRDNSFSTIQVFNNFVIPPPPPSPCEWVNNDSFIKIGLNDLNRVSESDSDEKLSNKNFEKNTDRKCIIL